MTARRDADIERRAKAGESLQAIADRHGLSRERVRQILLRRGVPTRRDLRAVTVERAVAAVQAGATVAQAAAEHRISAELLSAEVKAAGLDPKVRRSEIADAEAQRRLEGRGSTTCIRCGKTKPWSEMATTNSGGRRTRRRLCIECNRRQATESYRRRAGTVPEPTVEHRTCTRCGKVKPAAEFHRNTSDATGLQSWCKVCHAEASA